MWLTDFPVNPASYGCITIIGNKTDGITAHPSNPKPKWVHCKRGDPLPDGAIYAGKTNANGALYFGRVTSYSGIPCKINVNKDKLCHNWWYTYHGEGSEGSPPTYMNRRCDWLLQTIKDNKTTET